MNAVFLVFKGACMSTTAIDRGRITARVPARVQETLETAASMVGATINQFVVQSALREAERVIELERVIHLSSRDAQRFLSALDSPPPLSAKLVAALNDHTARSNDSTGTFNWSPR